LLGAIPGELANLTAARSATSCSVKTKGKVFRNVTADDFKAPFQMKLHTSPPMRGLFAFQRPRRSLPLIYAGSQANRIPTRAEADTAMTNAMYMSEEWTIIGTQPR
jgi:hypothetical protein